MHNLPRLTLIDLIAEHGLALCDDPRRLEAFLKDLCGQHKREIFVLVSALRESIVYRIREASSHLSPSLFMPTLAKRLHENLGFDEEIAFWAVESWRLAAQTSQKGADSPECEAEDPEDLNELIRSAEQGDPFFQVLVGWMYEDGYGVHPDEAKAAEWYRRAAKLGNPDAQNNLGRMYQLGCGVPQDDAKAAEWYRCAAEQGNPDAQYNLGSMFESGRGVPQDDYVAADWYSKSGEQGNLLAQKNLCALYANGRGLPED